MLGFRLYLMYILLILLLMTVLLIRIPGVVVLFRYIHSSTLFLQHPIVFQPVFWVRLTCVLFFHVCLLSRVSPRYGAPSVCCSAVSSNIIFMYFYLVDKVTVLWTILFYLSLHISLLPSLTGCLLLLGVVFWQLFCVP